MKTIFFYRGITFSFLTIFLFGKSPAQQEYKVLDRWNVYKNAHNALYDHYADIAFEMLDQRKSSIEAIQTRRQVQDRQGEIQKQLLASMGDFPEKTPLNAVNTRTIQKEKYSIEHLVYESQPGFHVSASVFKPKGIPRRAKLPVVIYCSGHSASGYRSPVYLHKILNLVHKGFMVLAFDPVSQGERLQYLNEDLTTSKVGGPTKEHSYAGAQAFITGSSQAKYMIWDGIRTVDYLLTRKDVDPARIGITGRSGGGTQSAYIAAFDERIYAVAPECYITNFTRLLQSIGPQDAEQNLNHFIEYGLDHADFLWVRAPKPAMIIATTNDFFSIQGARESAAELNKCYALLNARENFSMAEDVEGHASTRKNREAMYAFFQKALKNEGSTEDVEYELPTEDEMRVSQLGQILPTYSGKAIYDLISQEAEIHQNSIESLRKDPSAHSTKVKAYADQLMNEVSNISAYEEVYTGKIEREHYKIEKYIIQSEKGYPLPCLLFKPNNSTKKSLVFLHPDGKEALLSDSLLLNSLIGEGYTIMAPDLLGTGETFPKDYRGDAFINNVSYNLWFASILTGKNLAALRAKDVLLLTEICQKHAGHDDVSLFAYGEMSPVALLAANTKPVFDQLILTNALLSFQTVWKNTYYDANYVHNCPPGIAKHFDIPDLIGKAHVKRVVINGIKMENDPYYMSDGWYHDMEWLKNTWSPSGIFISEDIDMSWINKP